jgi:hypothetical protein
MRAKRWLFFLAVAASSAAAADLRFFYTANRQGEIDPCGCPTTEQNGGIDRMAALLAGAKFDPKSAFFGDAGDTFFSNVTLLPTRRAQELAQSSLIARVYRELGLEVFSPGERDFAGGIEELRRLQALTGAAFISANLSDREGHPFFPATALLEKQGVKIGVIGVADPTLFGAFPEVHAEPPEPAVSRAAGELRKQGADVVVVLSHLGLHGDQDLAKSGGVDLIIGSHSLDSLDPPRRVGDTWIVQPMYQGQQVGWITWDTTSRRFTGAKLVDLGRDWEKTTAVSRLIADYRKGRDRAEERGSASVAPAAPGAFVAHPASCRRCHAKQYAFWETTKHASAYLVLYAKDEHFNPECIGCHSLGFEKKGGYSSIVRPIVEVGEPPLKKGMTPLIEQIMKTVFAGDPGKGDLDSRVQPDRFAQLQHRYLDEIHRLEGAGKIERLYAGVQCEHCHGNLNGHPGNHRAVAKVVEATCRGCHRPPEAPHFDFAMVKLVGCPAGSR